MREYFKNKGSKKTVIFLSLVLTLQLHQTSLAFAHTTQMTRAKMQQLKVSRCITQISNARQMIFNAQNEEAILAGFDIQGSAVERLKKLDLDLYQEIAHSFLINGLTLKLIANQNSRSYSEQTPTIQEYFDYTPGMRTYRLRFMPDLSFGLDFVTEDNDEINSELKAPFAYDKNQNMFIFPSTYENSDLLKEKKKIFVRYKKKYNLNSIRAQLGPDLGGRLSDEALNFIAQIQDEKLLRQDNVLSNLNNLSNQTDKNDKIVVQESEDKLIFRQRLRRLFRSNYVIDRDIEFNHPNEIADVKNAIVGWVVFE